MKPMVEIIDRQIEGCTILDIRAESFTYLQTAVFKNYVAHLLERGDRYFVINLNDVRIIDSYGLATIISTMKNVRERGGNVALYGMSDMFAHLLKVTHLDKILEVWPTEAQAIYYLSSYAKAPSSP